MQRALPQAVIIIVIPLVLPIVLFPEIDWAVNYGITENYIVFPTKVLSMPAVTVTGLWGTAPEHTV